MKNLIFKLRHFFALLFIVLTISNITMLPNQPNSSNESFSNYCNGGIWLVSAD